MFELPQQFDLETLKKKIAKVEKDVSTKLDRARWWIFTQDHVKFYGPLIARLRDQIDWSPFNRTACTDGVRIYWNPGFVLSLDDLEVRFVILHEMLHSAHLHLWRLPPTPEGNMAGDYVINALLLKVPGVKMPKSGLYDPAFENMAEEEVLAKLPKIPQQQDSGGVGEGKETDSDDAGDFTDYGGCGGFRKPPPQIGKDGKEGQDKDKQGNVPHGGSGTPSEPTSSDPVKDGWERALVQAEITAKLQGVGSSPGGLDRVLQRIRIRNIDWKSETADFFHTCVNDSRNDWTKMSKRHSWQKTIYPKKIVDSIGTIVIIRDTSGSISDQEAAEQAEHIDICVAENNCDAVILDNDTRIRKEYRINPYVPCPRTAVGGGGTDFRYIPEYIRQLQDQGDEIAGVMIFSDGMGSEFTQAEWVDDIPLLWIIKNPWSEGVTTMATGRTINVFD